MTAVEDEWRAMWRDRGALRPTDGAAMCTRQTDGIFVDPTHSMAGPPVRQMAAMFEHIKTV